MPDILDNIARLCRLGFLEALFRSTLLPSVRVEIMSHITDLETFRTEIALP